MSNLDKIAAKTKKIAAKRVKPEINQVLEIGGKAIYELRSHTKKQPWELTAQETRMSYRCRMQEILNALALAGYKVIENPTIKASKSTTANEPKSSSFKIR